MPPCNTASYIMGVFVSRVSIKIGNESEGYWPYGNEGRGMGMGFSRGV